MPAKFSSQFVLQLFALCAIVATLADARAQATFEDVSAETGMTGFTESWGAAIGDLNNDNCLDIFVQGHRDYPRAYRNTCTGTFEDVTYEMDDGSWIALPQDDKHGAVFGDFDNDGDDDLFVSVSVTGDAQLWVNQGDGTFVNRATELNVRSDFAARIASFVDFNHDGKLDAVQMGLSPGSYFRYQNNLGAFSTQLGTEQACNQEDINFAHFIDINDDGTLELVCVARGEWPYLAYDISSIPFVDVTASLPSLGNVNSVIVGDFDRNLRTDVLMLRGSTRPSGAAFANSQRVEAWIARNPGDPANYGFNFRTGGSITMTVWNRDLSRNDPPFVVNLNQGQSGCNSQFAEYRVCATWNGGQNRWDVNMPDEGQAYIIIESTQNITNLNEVGLSSRDLPIAPRMYFNTAGGFNYSAAGLTVPVNCGGGTAADFDNDMDLDIYITCGAGPENIPNRLMINNGNGTFSLQAGSGAQGPVGVGFDYGVAENAVFTDYDLDGFVDLFVLNGLLFYPWGIGGPDTLLRNTTDNGNNWMHIRLQGVASNRDGMAAKVNITAGGITQTRVQDGGYTRWAQNQQWLHFGLRGNATANVQIIWPSGQVDNHNGVAANALYVATEGGAMVPASQGTPVFTRLQPGDECGEPPYDLNYGPASFLWRDCGTDNWHFRAQGGRAENVMRSIGTILGDSAFSGVSGVGLAGGDSVGTSPARQVNFNLGTRLTQVKGFNFSTAGQDEACFDMSRKDIRALIVGASGKRLEPPFDLVTLYDCGVVRPPDLSISDASRNENAGPLVFTVSLASATATAVHFTVSTQDGTATAASGDYSPLAFAPYTIPAGNLSTTITVPVGADAVAEPDETFGIALVDASNAFIADGDGIGTIRNDDGPVPTLAVADDAVFEDSDDLEFVVSLSIPSAADVSFNASTQGQTATFADGDYGGFTGQPHVIPAGSVTTTVVVPVTADARIESDETLLLILSNVSTNAIVTDSTAAGTIRNDDGGLPNLIIGDASGNEDTGSLTFNVTLTQAAAANVTFTASTSNGSATVANGDYTALVAQPRVIPAGSLSTTVTVNLGVDSTPEADETFTVSIANLSANANLSDGTATGTIVNDDSSGGPTELPVTSWLGHAGPVTTTGNRITYTGPTSGWNSAVYSTPLAGLGFTDEYEVRFAIVGNPASSLWVIGLGVDESGTDFRDIDYGLRNSNGTLQVYQNGTWGTTAGTLANGDVISIYVDGGNLEYRHNGAPFYTSTYAGSPAFYVDSAFRQGTISFDVTVAGPGTPSGDDPIVNWVNAAGGVSASGNDLAFTGTPSNWTSTINSVALSSLGALEDYTVSWTIDSNPAGTIWVVGLGIDETGAERTDVDFGLRSSNGVLEARENGLWAAAASTLSIGDELAIRVSGTTLDYQLNGVTFHSTPITGSESFYIDSAFKSGAIALGNFTLTR